MKRIPLDKAEPGMILAQKVIRDDGVLLCQKGTEVSDGVLHLLRRMNFETVVVESESEEPPEERAARIAKATAEIEARFVRVRSDPVLTALQNALIKRLNEDSEND